MRIIISIFGYEIEKEEDAEPFNVIVFDSHKNVLAEYRHGGHRPNGKFYQEKCRFKEGEKVVALFNGDYDALVPATVIGPVSSDYVRKEWYEDSESSLCSYDTFEEFQERLFDWDWDAVLVHPHVRLQGMLDGMAETECVPRVHLFPYRDFKKRNEKASLLPLT